MEKEQKANVVIFCEVLVASQPLIKNIYFFHNYCNAMEGIAGSS